MPLFGDEWEKGIVITTNGDTPTARTPPLKELEERLRREPAGRPWRVQSAMAKAVEQRKRITYELLRRCTSSSGSAADAMAQAATTLISDVMADRERPMPGWASVSPSAVHDWLNTSPAATPAKYEAEVLGWPPAAGHAGGNPNPNKRSGMHT